MKLDACRYLTPEIEVIQIGLFVGALCVSYGNTGQAGTDPVEDHSYDL